MSKIKNIATSAFGNQIIKKCKASVIPALNNDPDEKHGITFLVPTKDVIPTINKMDPAEFVNTMNKLVLQQCIRNISDFNNNDIPVSLMSDDNDKFLKLPNCTSVENGKAILSDGTEIYECKTTNLPNVTVCTVSKIPDVTEVSVYNHSNKPVLTNSVSGGFDYKNNGNSRKAVFESILNCYCSCKNRKNNTRDPALELLVALALFYFGTNRDIYDAITSLFSNDTITTLAIVLQPYRAQPTYISDKDYDNFAENNSDATNVNYCYINNPSEMYKKMMKNSAAKYKDTLSTIVANRNNMLPRISKPTLINNIKQFYTNIGSLPSLPDLRKKALKEYSLLLAEGELRVMSAILHDNNNGQISTDELTKLFSSFTLNKPYIMDSQDSINSTNIAYFFSGIYAMVRSDYIYYMAGISDIDKSAKCLYQDNYTVIINERNTINFNGGFKLITDDAYASNSSIINLQEKNAKLI
jgi:hypothetical protein